MKKEKKKEQKEKVERITESIGGVKYLVKAVK